MKVTKRKSEASASNDDHATKLRKEKKFYTNQEILKILEFMRDTILSGRQIEKPNARQYYNQLLETTGILNCDNISLINKIGTLKDSYNKAIKWRNETGQGVDDETSVREYTIKLCKYFDLLDEIFGARVIFHVPYVSETVDFGSSGESVDTTVPNNSILATNSEPGSGTPRGVPSPKRPSCARTPKKPPSDFVLATMKRAEVRQAETAVEKEKVRLDEKKLTTENAVSLKKIILEERNLDIEQITIKDNAKISSDKMDIRRRKLAIEERKSDIQIKQLEDEMLSKRERLDKEIELKKFEISENVRLKIELAKLNKSDTA